MIKNKAAASHCFLDQFHLFFSWIDTKTIGFMDEHGHSPSSHENVCSMISYRHNLYNVCKKQVIAWCPYSNYYLFHSIGFRTVRQLWVAKAIPCLKAIHLPLTTGLFPSRA